MNKFNEHFLLDEKSVIEFVVERVDGFKNSRKLRSEEIGDGNINYVYRVIDEDSGRSVIVKQAGANLRTSGRPLDIGRNKIEYTSLEIYSKACPKLVPKLYFYSSEMAAMVMEDLGAQKTLREALFSEEVVDNFVDEISDFISLAVFSTSDIIGDREEKKRLVKEFVNVDMCDISEDLVFAEPYDDYKGRNTVLSKMEGYVKAKLYDDIYLHREVASLRNNFMNNTQSLIHGDLHSGSIFVGDKSIKVIDAEFAFFGPLGYDLGNVLAHLVFALSFCYFEKSKETYCTYLESTMLGLVEKVSSKLKRQINNYANCSLYKEDYFIDDYVTSIINDAMGYCGLEIIRRVVGDTKVPEIERSVKDRIGLEKYLIDKGISLIKNRRTINTGWEFLCIIRKSR